MQTTLRIPQRKPKDMGKRRLGSTARVVAALAAGLTIDIAISASGNAALRTIAAAAEPIGILWINAIRMTVIPLVVSLLFVSMTSFSDVRSAGRTGGRALLIFAAFLVASALFAILTVPVLFSWLPTGASTTVALGQMSTSSAVREQAQQLPTFVQWLTDLVPTNPMRAAADGALLPLVIFTVLFGLASTGTAPDQREALVRFFRALSESMLTLVGWLIALAPLGVFALILPLAARMGASAVGAFGYYVIAICGLLCVQTLALYPIAAVVGRVPAKRFAQAVFPAQAIAFSSSSSLASLPALLEGAEKKLERPPELMGFVLPLAVSIFKINTPIVWLAGACFVARLYAVPFGPAQVGLVLVASVLLSFTTPGIPMGSVVVLAPVFASAGLPVEGVGILIAVDLVPDLFKTIANVTGDMAAAALLSRADTAHVVQCS
jgi:proton glutamate symport protein